MNQQELTAMMDTVVELGITYGLNVIAAILILIVGLWISRRVETLVRRGLERTGRIDSMLSGFLSAVARYLVLTVTIIAVLSQFGIEIASLLVVFGSVGLAIGLALQGTLSNVAAGVMLLLFRPFKAGDFVEIGGMSGTVKAVSLFFTELATPDNVQIIVPNGQVWGSALTNYSFHDTRRINLALGISYGDDIDKATAIVRRIVDADGRILRDPEPMIIVNALGDSSVDLSVRVWTRSDDYWATLWHLNKAVKEAFDDEGVTIPFPSRTVYHIQQAQAVAD